MSDLQIILLGIALNYLVLFIGWKIFPEEKEKTIEALTGWLMFSMIPWVVTIGAAVCIAAGIFVISITGPIYLLVQYVYTPIATYLLSTAPNPPAAGGSNR